MEDKPLKHGTPVRLSAEGRQLVSPRLAARLGFVWMTWHGPAGEMVNVVWSGRKRPDLLGRRLIEEVHS